MGEFDTTLRRISHRVFYEVIHHPQTQSSNSNPICPSCFAFSCLRLRLCVSLFLCLGVKCCKHTAGFYDFLPPAVGGIIGLLVCFILAVHFRQNLRSTLMEITRFLMQTLLESEAEHTDFVDYRLVKDVTSLKQKSQRELIDLSSPGAARNPLCDVELCISLWLCWR